MCVVPAKFMLQCGLLEQCIPFRKLLKENWGQLTFLNRQFYQQLSALDFFNFYLSYMLTLDFSSLFPILHDLIVLFGQ